MARYDKRQLYIKRVLREIRRHSDDRWIDIEIEKDLRDRFGDKTDAEAVAQMPSWRLAAMNYRVKYSESAEALDGFTPQTVQRLLTNFAAPAIELLAAFVVFRLFPTTEYVAYIVCALAAIAAAIQQHVCFCKFGYSVASIVLPVFLLIWYPARDAAANAYGFADFFGRLFSDGNRYIIILILAIVIFYTLTTAILHARDYADKPIRGRTILASAILILCCVSGFAAYTSYRNESSNEQSAIALAEIKEAYAEYQSTGDVQKLLETAQKADSIVKKNFHRLSKMDESYSDNFYRMFSIFDLCRTAEDSSSYQALMDSYFTDFDETDETRTLNTEAISVTYSQLTDRFESRMSSVSGEKYADLHGLASSAGGLQAELYSVIDDCHTAWIFSKNEK